MFSNNGIYMFITMIFPTDDFMFVSYYIITFCDSMSKKLHPDRVCH